MEIYQESLNKSKNIGCKVEIQGKEQSKTNLFQKIERKLRLTYPIDALRKEMKNFRQPTRNIYEFVHKAKGFHNVQLAQELLEKAQKDLEHISHYLEVSGNKDSKKGS